MLKGLSPLLTPELLHILASMGHGDEIVIADANFPAASAGRPLIRLDGIDAPRIANAILSVMPLDDFVPECAWHMQVVGDPAAQMPIFDDFRAALATHGDGAVLAPLERFAFYERIKAASLIVQGGEPTAYGNALFCKGVILG